MNKQEPRRTEATFPTGEAPWRDGHTNPLLRVLPVSWEAKKSGELIEAERRLEELRSEAAGLDERYADALARGDAGTMVETRVRADLMPELLGAALVVHLRERSAWLRESKALITPWAEHNVSRVEVLKAELDRLDEAIIQVELVGAELWAANYSLVVQLGDVNRELNRHAEAQRPRSLSRPLAVTA